MNKWIDTAFSMQRRQDGSLLQLTKFFVRDGEIVSIKWDDAC